MDCIIIEDQQPAQRILKKYIKDAGSLNLLATFSDALEAMNWLGSHSTEVIFLDIHLPKLSGLEFLKSIQNPPQVILTTAFPDYALESYELDVVDYLLKPFSFQRFVKAISKLKSDKNPEAELKKETQLNPREIFLKSSHEYIKVDVSQILYINSDSDYTDIHLAHKKFLSSESLKHWENKLNTFNFIRVHKSYIVNLDQIEKIAGNRIFLISKDQIPIGRTYKKILSNRFIN